MKLFGFVVVMNSLVVVNSLATPQDDALSRELWSLSGRKLMHLARKYGVDDEVKKTGGVEKGELVTLLYEVISLERARETRKRRMYWLRVAAVGAAGVAVIAFLWQPLSAGLLSLGDVVAAKYALVFRAMERGPTIALAVLLCLWIETAVSAIRWSVILSWISPRWLRRFLPTSYLPRLPIDVGAATGQGSWSVDVFPVALLWLAQRLHRRLNRYVVTQLSTSPRRRRHHHIE